MIKNKSNSTIGKPVVAEVGFVINWEKAKKKKKQKEKKERKKKLHVLRLCLEYSVWKYGTYNYHKPVKDLVATGIIATFTCNTLQYYQELLYDGEDKSKESTKSKLKIITLNCKIIRFSLIFVRNGTLD